MSSLQRRRSFSADEDVDSLLDGVDLKIYERSIEPEETGPPVNDKEGKDGNRTSDGRSPKHVWAESEEIEGLSDG